MQILKRLGFNMQVSHHPACHCVAPFLAPSDPQVDLPYSHVINYCKILDLVFEPEVAQTAWSILNDA